MPNFYNPSSSMHEEDEQEEEPFFVIHEDGEDYIDYQDDDESYPPDDISLRCPYEWCYTINRWDADIIKARNIKLSDKIQYYGAELEFIFDVETRGEYRELAGQILSKWGNEVMLVHDGSFARYGPGAEVVTVPMTCDDLLEFGKGFYTSEFIPKLKKCPITGMHLHVSKGLMSAFTQVKILNLVYNNASWFKMVTNKNTEDYCSYEPRTMKPVHRLYNTGKYVAVNCRPLRTLEFRFFTVPLTYTGFKERLFFVKSIIDFCENTAYKDINLDNFLNSPYLVANVHNLKNY